MSPYVILASAASLLNSTILYGLGRHRGYLKASFAGAISAVILSLCLVPVLRLNGAGIALLGGELAVVLAAYFGLPAFVRDLWKNPILATVVLSSIMMGMTVTWAGFYIQQPLVLISIGIIVYALICVRPVGRWLSNELRGES
jgi:O-antigen/teichoic acid export membrane protein